VKYTLSSAGINVGATEEQPTERRNKSQRNERRSKGESDSSREEEGEGSPAHWPLQSSATHGVEAAAAEGNGV